MSKVQAQTKSVRELLSGVKYDIDFYQRGYEWQRRNIEELLDDFEAEFTANYSEAHEPRQVADYRHYFLGTIITIPESGKRYIVDGQQRLTTLTLMLIYFHHQRAENPAIPDVSRLIYEEVFMEKSFIIAVEEREDCMKALFERGGYDAADHADLSLRNLVERYEDIGELFPKSLTGKALPYFVSWLLHCVDIVEIEAQTDDAAFTIFETMNDRGVNLSQSDMLKGYLLAHINFADSDLMHARKTAANAAWKRRMTDFASLEQGDSDDFFRTWLRAKYAANTRERRKGAGDADYERISKYHRWARDNRQRLGLNENDSQAYYDFITERMRRFAGYYIGMKRAAQSLATGREDIYYNAYNNFTLQYMLAMAPLKLDDNSETAWRKIRLVAAFADIFLARRMVNFRRNGYGTLQYTMFTLAKEIRDAEVDELRDKLRRQLDDMRWNTTFAGVIGEYPDWRPPTFSLNNFSGRSIRYLLARMTAWVERESGANVNFRNFLWDAKGKPFEIEHIWADKFERHEDEYSHENDFQRERNYFGGLILLPRDVNRSLNDKPYSFKLEKYREQNLLAATLHRDRYANAPGLRQFIERTRLPFKPHAEFKRADLLERQQLYRQICERIWDPERLNKI